MPAERFRTSILHPEWLPTAIENANRTFRLALDDRLPSGIAGWMITGSCMQILRAVYGDDLSTAVAIRRAVLEQNMPPTEEEMAMTAADETDDAMERL